jgi:hypothetical protein
MDDCRIKFGCWGQIEMPEFSLSSACALKDDMLVIGNSYVVGVKLNGASGVTQLAHGNERQ